MITKYANTYANAQIVKSLPTPKHVWFDGQTIVVYTGPDLPVDGVSNP